MGELILYLYPEKPRLISIDQPLFDKLSKDPRWVAEPKYNGNRLVLIMDGDDVQFWNRHGEKFSYSPDEELVRSLARFHTKGRCMFDGELRNNKVPGIKHRIVLWDTFMWDGKLLVDKPYSERRSFLPWEVARKNFAPTKQATNLHSYKRLFHEWIKDPEIEGMVIKKSNGMLNLSRTRGQDSNWMVKVRRPSNSYRF